MADPPVRADGLCAQCGGERRPERSRRYGKAAAELDPFCSTEHCRAWHGCPVGESRAGSLGWRGGYRREAA